MSLIIRPQKVLSKVIKNEKISSKVHLVAFEHSSPQQLQFLPGHFINLQVGPMSFRSYSISSDYKDTKTLSLVVSAAHDGLGANYIKSLKVDDLVTFIGPSGRFLIPKNIGQNLVLLATGTGISAFITYLYKFVDLSYTGKVKLFFGVRNESEQFFIDLLNEFKSKLPNFDYEICFSSLGNRVTNHIKSDIDPTAQYFLCGNPNMIEDALQILDSQGISIDNIFYEKFTITGAEQ